MPPKPPPARAPDVDDARAVRRADVGHTLAERVRAALKRAKIDPGELSNYVFVSQADGSLKLEPRNRVAARFEASDRSTAWWVANERPEAHEALLLRGRDVARVPIDRDDEGT